MKLALTSSFMRTHPFYNIFYLCGLNIREISNFKIIIHSHVMLLYNIHPDVIISQNEDIVKKT